MKWGGSASIKASINSLLYDHVVDVLGGSTIGAGGGMGMAPYPHSFVLTATMLSMSELKWLVLVSILRVMYSFG